MTLERRLIVLSVLIALPVASLAAQAIAWVRARDLATAIERVVTAQLNEQVRERCESDPTWFLTGTLEGRPHATDPKPGPDELPARPRADVRPYELFAYDEEFVASSPIGPRFPNEFKYRMRAGAPFEADTFEGPDGSGAQYATRTGWSPGPCSVLLGRLHASPNGLLYWWLIFFGVEILAAGLFVAAGTPTVRRIQGVARGARAAARSEWTVVVPAEGHDELTAVGAALNEASADLRRRIADIRDRDETHRRFVARTSAEIAHPLERLAAHVGGGPAGADLLRDMHDVSLHLGNLIAAARLRMYVPPGTQPSFDLRDVVARAASEWTTLATARAVTLNVETPSTPVVVTGDQELVDQALSNLVDNAIRHNRRGGHVAVRLGPSSSSSGFALRVLDDGPGVTDEQLAAMNAIRRFRGDEGRADRPRQRGLGLALVWEIVERTGWQMTIHQSAAGGLEITVTGSYLFSTDPAVSGSGLGAAPPAPPLTEA